MKSSRSKESNKDKRNPSPLLSKIYVCPHSYDSVDAADDEPLGVCIGAAGMAVRSNRDIMETRHALSKSESTRSFKLQSQTATSFQKTSLEGFQQVTLSNHVQGRRVPCKARGMGESHGPQSAFFDIRQETRHGEVSISKHEG